MPSVHPSKLPPHKILLSERAFKAAKPVKGARSPAKVQAEKAGGLFALVDEVDSFRLEGMSWQGKVRRGKVYPMHGRKVLHEGERVSVTVSLGVYIMNAHPGQTVEYLDGDPSNCRRANLQVTNWPNARQTGRFYIEGATGQVRDNPYYQPKARKVDRDPLDECWAAE